MADNANAFPFAQRVAIVNKNGKSNILLGDTVYGGSLVITDIGHHEIHCGDHYVASSVTDVGNGGTDDIFIIVPSHETKRYHMVVEVVPEAEAQFDFYRSASLSVSGSAIASYNRDENSTNTFSVPPGYHKIWGAVKGGGSPYHIGGGPSETEKCWAT